MTGYDGAAARFYDRHYGQHARTAGLQILDFAKRQSCTSGTMVDVCCGTGQLAEVFAQAGFTVVGVDLSVSMLFRARSRSSLSGSARAGVVQGDATRIPLADQCASLVVCSTDSVNHLPRMDAVGEFIRSAARILRPGGWLVADILTRRGFTERNGVHVLVDDSSAAIVREMFDEGSGRSMSSVTAFNRDRNGLYHRLDMGASRIVIDPLTLLDIARDSGFSEAFLSWPDSLGEPVTGQDTLLSGGERVYILARLGQAENGTHRTDGNDQR